MLMVTSMSQVTRTATAPVATITITRRKQGRAARLR
jgi:hypothetical protein